MLSFDDFLQEELNPNQKAKVQKWVSKRSKSALDFSNHVFGKESRVIVPLSGADTAPHPDVESHLHANGYKIQDYRKGIALDKWGRETKIGKALTKTKAPDNVINTFANDSARQAKAHGDLQVVISRHPEDVAGMSTGRNWDSCMEMDTGSNKEYLEKDIKHGTHVAYLTKKGDNEAQNPLARISLKPYVQRQSSNPHKVLRPESRMYGSGNDAFAHTVRQWSEEHFPLKKYTSYEPHSMLYDDSAAAAYTSDPRKNYTHSSIIFSNDKETKDHLLKHGDWPEHHAVAVHGDKEHLDQLINHDMYHIRATVLEHGHPDHLEAAIKDKHEFVRAGVAKHGTDEHREQLVKDKHFVVRREVARHDEKYHNILSKDSNIDVRAAVAKTSTNRDILNKLRQDTHFHVASAASAGLLYLKHLDEAKTLNRPTPDRAAY